MICSPLLKEKLWTGKIQQGNYPTYMPPYNYTQSSGFIPPLRNSQARRGQSLSEDISKNYSKISERYWEDVKIRNNAYRQRQIAARSTPLVQTEQFVQSGQSTEVAGPVIKPAVETVKFFNCLK